MRQQNLKLLVMTVVGSAVGLAASVGFAQGAQQPAAGSSTATLSAVAPESTRKFKFVLANISSMPKEGFDKNTPSASGYNRFQMSYSLTDTKSIIVREDSLYKYDVTTRKSEFHVADPFIGYTDTKFAELPYGWVITVQPRLYLPLGETSRFVSQSWGSEAILVLADKSVGKFDFEIAGFFQYHNNTQDYNWAYNEGLKRWDAKTNTHWMSFVEGEVGYNITPKIALLHDVYLITKTGRANFDAPSVQTNILMNETIVSFKPTKWFNLQLSVEDDVELDSQNAVTMYQDKNMLYNFTLKFTL